MYDRNASKRAVNVSLNEDLVRQAKALTRNLSATLEQLLQEFVVSETSRRQAETEKLDRLIDDFNALHRRHGLLSDEFSNF
jgi:antitoxin CcdA